MHRPSSPQNSLTHTRYRPSRKSCIHGHNAKLGVSGRVVVDDGSQDNTWSMLRDLSVYALRHPLNLGQGAALQTGMTFALRQGAEIIVHFDGDGQHRVEDIDVLVSPLRKGEIDVVFGSRFLREVDKQAVPPSRRVLL